MSKSQAKQIMMSILIGAGVAFFSTLFQSLADFFKANSTGIISGSATAFYHLTKTYNCS